MQRKKILLITPMLHQGGFERICAMTAKLLADTCEVHIAVFTKKDMFYDVSGVDLIDLDLPAKSGKINKIVNIIKRAMRLKALEQLQILLMFYQRRRTRHGQESAATAH